MYLELQKLACIGLGNLRELELRVERAADALQSCERPEHKGKGCREAEWLVNG